VASPSRKRSLLGGRKRLRIMMALPWRRVIGPGWRCSKMSMWRSRLGLFTRSSEERRRINLKFVGWGHGEKRLCLRFQELWRGREDSPAYHMAYLQSSPEEYIHQSIHICMKYCRQWSTKPTHSLIRLLQNLNLERENEA